MYYQTQKQKKTRFKPRIKIEPQHIYCHSVRECSVGHGRKCATTVHAEAVFCAREIMTLGEKQILAKDRLMAPEMKIDYLTISRRRRREYRRIVTETKSR